MAVDTAAPTREIGARFTPTGGGGWSGFIDDAELTPELMWPSSVPTYHKMRTESQIEALHLGTTQPVREFRWSIDPNGATAALTERVAMDFGLPVKGHEDDNIPRSALSFDFDNWLADALLAPLYGFFYFEIVGEVNDDMTEWHMVNLSPRHPRTIGEFQTVANGDLTAIRQNIAPAVQMPGGAAFHIVEPIPATKLVPLVWRREAGSWVGRSMLRSLYREWLVKDRVIRVAAINLERAGGMPVIEGPQGASDAQLRQLATLARQFKVAEGGGGAIPFGSKLTLVGGSTPDAIDLLKYCDEAMARVWALMLVQLGMTTTGNRALGSEFATYAARAQRAMAKWVAAHVNRFLDRYTEWNVGQSAKYAPRLIFEQSKPDAMSVAELVDLVDAGAIHVDPELESWLRDEHGLPARDPSLPFPAPPVASPTAPLTDEKAAEQTPTLASGAIIGRGGDGFDQADPQRESAATGSSADDPLSAHVGGRPSPVVAALTLPDRKLRRQPYPQEVRAAVDFRGLDYAHEATRSQIEALYRTTMLPAQIDALVAQITHTKAGDERQRLTRSITARLQAPSVGRDGLVPVLRDAARSGAHAAAAELGAQGIDATVPDDERLASLVSDQASAVSAMAANGLSLMAQRRASAMVGTGSPASVANDLRGHLTAAKHQWTSDQLQGAVTMAQNAGRFATFDSADQGALSYYASELLDVNCCGPCTDIDGTQYASLADAERDYPGSQYVECAGGPRCRGTLVAVAAEQNPLSSSNPVLPALA